MGIETSGFEQLKRNLEAMRANMTGPVARKAVRAGANVIAEAMEERAPVQDKRTQNSSSLQIGEMRDDIKARNSTVDGKPAAIAGPTKKTARQARWVEYGHRMVSGGQSKVLANGKTRGRGKASEVDVPAHPFLRPAFEASVAEAEAARDEVFKQGLEGKA